MKIFDCFTFFNEFDLLEIRLNTLWDVVDYFVVSEADYTHSGEEKPYNLINKINEFSRYLSKLIIVPAKLDESNLNATEIRFGSNTGQSQNLNWRREAAQRNQLMNGLVGRAELRKDLVVVSDCDEIPNPEALKTWKETPTWSNGIPHKFDMAFYYYKLNLVRKPNGWRKSFIKSFDSTDNFTKIRNMEGPEDFIIQNAGWHFSWLGDVNQAKEKLKGFAHQEYRNQIDLVEERMKNNQDVLGRGDIYRAVPIDDSFPKYIRENQEKLAHLIKK